MLSLFALILGLDPPSQRRRSLESILEIRQLRMLLRAPYILVKPTKALGGTRAAVVNINAHSDIIQRTL